VRFAARFDYKIEPTTLMAIRRLAPQIDVISPERIREELTKMLTEGVARRAFELLDTTHLLPVVLPEIAKLKGVPQPPEYHPEGDVWIHTLMLLEGLPAQASPTLAWGALLHDVGKPSTFRPVSVTGDRIRFDGHVDAGVLIGRDILKRLRFSNEQSEQILALVANHMKFKDVSKMKPATLKRFVRQPRFDEHLELHRLDCLSSNGRLDAYNAVRTFLAETPVDQVSPPRLLSGSDLQDMGYCAGPAFQGMLRAIEDAQLNGTVQTREAAEQFVREHYPLKKVGR
jgi:poly(A) polymerase